MTCEPDPASDRTSSSSLLRSSLSSSSSSSTRVELGLGGGPPLWSGRREERELARAEVDSGAEEAPLWYLLWVGSPSSLLDDEDESKAIEDAKEAPLGDEPPAAPPLRLEG